MAKKQKIEIKNGKRRIKRGVSYWELGPGIRLYSTQFFCDILGVSPQWLSELTDALGVPYFFTRTRAYIRYETFLKAMAFITELGQPDFAGPRSDQKFGLRRRKRLTVTQMDLEKFLEDEDRLIQGIQMGAHLHGKELDKDVEVNLRRAFRDFKESARKLAEDRRNG